MDSNNSNSNKRATIKEVARTAGVSIATVSRVLNKNYYVSPDIEQKVQNAILTTGYVPDSIARTMKKIQPISWVSLYLTFQTLI
jgi:DNA-binding LacI/PurR family transcriptional regulator